MNKYFVRLTVTRSASVIIGLLLVVSGRHLGFAQTSSWGPSIKDLKDALADFITVRKYLQELQIARENGKSVEPPRLGKIIYSNEMMKRLDTLLKALQEYKGPPVTNLSSPPLPTMNDIIKARDSSALRQLDHNAVDSLSAMFDNFVVVNQAQHDMDKIVDTASAVHDAALVIKDALIKLTATPLPEALNIFGLPAAELEVSFVPKISSIVTEAKLRAGELGTQSESSMTHINNFSGNVQTLLHEELRRTHELSEELKQRSPEIDEMRKGLDRESRECDSLLEREEQINRRGIAHNRRADELAKQRQAFQAYVAQLGRSNPGCIFDETCRNSVASRENALNAQENALRQERALLEPEMAKSNQRRGALQKRQNELNARVARFNELYRQLGKDILEFNSRQKAISADQERIKGLFMQTKDRVNAVESD